MTTLILHTPSKKVQSTKQSFNQTISNQRAVGFAMGKNLAKLAEKCEEVIILDKNAKLKATAKMGLISVSAQPPTRSNLIRYDISFSTPSYDNYENERLNKNGVGIRDGKTIIVPIRS